MSSASTVAGVGAGTRTSMTSPAAGRTLLRAMLPFRSTAPSASRAAAREREISGTSSAISASRRVPAWAGATVKRRVSDCSGVVAANALLFLPEREREDDRARRDRDIGYVEDRPAGIANADVDEIHDAVHRAHPVDQVAHRAGADQSDRHQPHLVARGREPVHREQ